MSSELHKAKMREYNREYYQKNKERIIKSRIATDELKKAIWQVNYWTRRIEKIKAERGL